MYTKVAVEMECSWIEKKQKEWEEENPSERGSRKQ